MLALKSPLSLGIFFLVVSLASPLVAGPFDNEKKPDRPPGQQENQERRVSEDEGSSSLEQRGSVAHIKDWDDLLNQQPSQQAQSSSAAGSGKTVTESEDVFPAFSNKEALAETSEDKREKIFEQLGQAAQQAYARGDENHPDWDKVAELIEELRPEDGSVHRERRFSLGGEAEAAEAEELQVHFFRATLPAIKKTSVVAALRALNNFQTVAIIDKADEEDCAWRRAKSKFEAVCRDHKLDPDGDLCSHDPTSDQKDEDFDQPDPFHAYLHRFSYKADRGKIERQLDVLHHNIMQNLIEGNVCTKDFETRVFSAKKITNDYQPLLAAITTAKKSADPEIQHKWEHFQQETEARCLEDLVQAEKIKLCKNKNRVASINKSAERAHEQVERAPVTVGMHALGEYLKQQNQEALRAWNERKVQLETFQTILDGHKASLSLKISIAIEQEITTGLAAAAEAIQYWRERQAQLPLKILESQMKCTRHFYEIASQQYEFEKQLKRNGNPALARYNKEKYLGLASEQYKKTMQLVQALKADVGRSFDAVWTEQGEQFQKEFTNNRLFLLMAPLIKSEDILSKIEMVN